MPPAGSVALADVDYALSGSWSAGGSQESLMRDRPVALPGVAGGHLDGDPAHREPHRYALLDHELDTRPRTTYLARVTNPNPELAS